jgi:hypothetical protein
MDGLEILESLRTLGVTVTAVEPDRLRLEPASKIPAEMVARIREAKPGILEALRNRPASCEELPATVNPLPGHGEVAELLKMRGTIPPMPPGVRLVEWKLKEPPVAIETCAVVTDPALFASTTLEQLRTALANPRRCVGWSVPQLIDRLAQVGVTVALDESETTRKSGRQNGIELAGVGA